MAVAKYTTAYDDFLDYLIEKATHEEILAYQASEKVQARAIELLERSSEATLTTEERAELEEMLYVDDLVAVLKARALETLSKK